MLTMKQWECFTPARRKQKITSGDYTYIPSNDVGMPEGYYQDADLIGVLRERKAEPKVVQFILDMLE